MDDRSPAQPSRPAQPKARRLACAWASACAWRLKPALLSSPDFVRCMCSGLRSESATIRDFEFGKREVTTTTLGLRSDHRAPRQSLVLDLEHTVSGAQFDAASAMLAVLNAKTVADWDSECFY